MSIIDKYTHECIEWDYLTIDSKSPELSCCDCFDGEEFKAIREAHQLKNDLDNENLIFD